jgi:hypothetical protein
MCYVNILVASMILSHERLWDNGSAVFGERLISKNHSSRTADNERKLYVYGFFLSGTDVHCHGIGRFQ